MVAVADVSAGDLTLEQAIVLLRELYATLGVSFHRNAVGYAILLMEAFL